MRFTAKAATVAALGAATLGFTASPASAGDSASINWDAGFAVFNHNYLGDDEGLFAHDSKFGDGFGVRARLWANGAVQQQVTDFSDNNQSESERLNLLEGKVYYLQLCKVEGEFKNVKACSAKERVVS